MRYCKTCILLAIIVFSQPPAEARLLNVPEDYQTIQAALDSAEAGDTLLIQPGSYDENISVTTSGIVLGSLLLTTGDPAYIDSTIIDGGGRDCVVSIDVGWQEGTCMLRGFTIQNGGGQRFGGGVDCQSGQTIYLEDLLVTGNSADYCGGGIYTRTGATIRRSVIRDNEAWNSGGGIGFRGSQVLMEDCIVTGNLAGRGGAFGNITEGGSSNALIRRCLVTGNEAGVCSVGWFYYCRLEIDHCTISANYALNDSLGYSCIVVNNPNGYPASIKNSIVYQNGESQLSASEGWVNVSYSDIEEGRDSVRGFIDWGEGNIDADPLFANPDEGDYRLTEDSPCIDAGDPDQPDDDQTPSDMGAFPFSLVRAWVGGRVFDAATNEPIPDVIITCDRRFASTLDSLGNWTCPIPGRFDSLRVVFTFHAERYLPKIVDRFIHRGDSLNLQVGIEYSQLRLPEEPFSVSVDSGGSQRFPLTLQNIGTGLLTWSAQPRTVGEADFEPFSLRDSLLVTQITEDWGIEGVAFDGEHYYLSGANGDDPNLIYVLSRDGAVIHTFEQIGSQRTGYKDLEWDGEYLWGAGEELIYAFTPEGIEARSWNDPLVTTNCIAFDSRGGVLWLCRNNSDITAFDRLGNRLGPVIENDGMLIYGLGWLENDPDGANLIAIVRDDSDDEIRSVVFKINPATGVATELRSFLPEVRNSIYQYAYICRNYDKYGGAVLMMILNRNSNLGGDRLDVYQLEPNRDWFTVSPDQGFIPAGEEAVIDLIFQTNDGDIWSFDLGEYEAELVFTSDSRDGESVMPINMTVVEPRVVAPVTNHIPLEFSLTAFPNPFNASTTINYSLPSPGRYAIDVVDIQGRLVTRLSDGWREAGSYREVWDASQISQGTFFARINTNAKSKSVPILLIK